MTKFGDHRGGSSVGNESVQETNITGACFEQTTRDISLTPVDGTHSNISKMRVAGRVANVAICHRREAACNIPALLGPTHSGRRMTGLAHDRREIGLT
jgi:hypothetical protein